MDTDLKPITGVCVVSDPGRVPHGYTVLSKTSDSSEDADLWADRFFSRKTTRYICVTRKYPLDNGRLNNVVVDISLVNEKDPLPHGYSPLDLTIDSREKATNKKLICVQMVPRASSTHAICDIQLQNKTRRAPSGYTLLGEINGLYLSFKPGPVPDSGSSNGRRTPDVTLPYKLNQGAPPVPSRTAPPAPYATTLQRHYSVTSPLAGVPFEINNSLLTDGNDIYQNTLPVIGKKTLLDIEKEYAYSFQLEYTTKQRHSPERSLVK